MIFAFLMCLPLLAQAEGTGIVPGSIWLSNPSPEPGQTVAIYTAVYNSGTQTLSGEVEFRDGEVKIGSKIFSVPAGEVAGVSASWKATAGRHAFSAHILNAAFVDRNGARIAAPISRAGSEEAKANIAPTFSQAVDVGKEKLASTTEKLVDVVTDGLVAQVVAAVPEPVKVQTAVVHEALEDWRAESAKDFETKRVEAKKKIDAGASRVKEALRPKETEEEANKNLPRPIPATPFDYAGWLFFGLLAFIFKQRLLFYGILLVLVYFAVRWVINRFRG